jgi:hypothetical protein
MPPVLAERSGGEYANTRLPKRRNLPADVLATNAFPNRPARIADFMMSGRPNKHHTCGPT